MSLRATGRIPPPPTGGSSAGRAGCWGKPHCLLDGSHYRTSFLLRLRSEHIDSHTVLSLSRRNPTRKAILEFDKLVLYPSITSETFNCREMSILRRTRSRPIISCGRQLSSRRRETVGRTDRSRYGNQQLMRSADRRRHKCLRFRRALETAGTPSNHSNQKAIRRLQKISP